MWTQHLAGCHPGENEGMIAPATSGTDARHRRADARISSRKASSTMGRATVIASPTAGVVWSSVRNCVLPDVRVSDGKGASVSGTSSSSTRRSARTRVGSALALALTLAGCTPDSPTTDPSDPPATTPGVEEAERRLVDQPDGQPLDPGRYVMSLSGATMLPVLTVPDGYSHSEAGSGVFVTDDTGSDGYSPHIAVWDISAVYTHPCDEGSRLEQVGPSVADLATALAAQPLRNGSTPAPVRVGGYDGLYVELSVPDDADFTECPGRRFNSWPGRWQQGPGQIDMIWILDVEGERLVLNAMHGPSAPPEQVDEVRRIVSTATFTSS